ncbi:Peptidase S10 serine carboxypeptidase, partial [Penicillium alfredii]
MKHYPEFAVNNTHGIKAVNDTVYSFMKFANEMALGCRDQRTRYKLLNRTSVTDYALCSEALYVCRDTVEGPYYYLGNRAQYDIRHPTEDPALPNYWPKYLTKEKIQNAIGVDLNYTSTSPAIQYAFQQNGEAVWPNFLEDLEAMLARPVRVALIYGDADYTCNWFGGEDISLNTKYKHSKEFRSAGYASFLVDGVEHGVTREYGNFSFTRVYGAGHEVPFYQPKAALQIFNSTLNGWEIPGGRVRLTAKSRSRGPARASHSQSSVPLPSATSSASGGAVKRRSFF